MRDYQFIALILAGLSIIVVALVFANLSLTGGGDFFVHWVGGRAFLLDKVEPYSWEVAVRTQIMVYGSRAAAGQEPYILDTPFHILPFYFPFSLLSDPRLARAIFTAILEVVLFGLVLLSLRLTEWKSSRLFSILFIFLGVFNFYSFQAVQEANPVLLLGLLYLGILFSLRANMDELAGALIALSIYYWEVGAPFLFLVVLRVAHEKRKGVLPGFLMVSFVLIAISLLLYPGWIIPCLRATVNNLRSDFGYNIHATLKDLWPAHGQALAWVVISVFAIILAYEWHLARGADFRQFYWASCLTLAVTPLLGFRTEMEHLSILVIPLVLFFAVVHDRWHGMGDGLTIVLLLLILIVPWILYYFARGRIGAMADGIVFLFLPTFTFLGLYWIRWWALHPPLTWLDQVKRP